MSVAPTARLRYLFQAAVALILLSVLLTAFHWPTDSDQSAELWMKAAAKTYYTQVYSQEDELRYRLIAKAAAEDANILGKVQDFVREYGLTEKRVLDIGAGRGYLQDVVKDYVGLDLSSTAKNFFHKPFVEASATAMPFPDSSFDGAWSIWVVEHIPEPEKTFNEIRRVVKPGGFVYLFPAWNASAFNGEGYEVRPYSDFGWRGKMIKASQLFVDSKLAKAMYIPPRRILRAAAQTISPGPSTLKYRRIVPNFSRYWTTDSDAVIQLDRQEALLWFRSRGDECMNCSVGVDIFGRSGVPLILRIRK